MVLFKFSTLVPALHATFSPFGSLWSWTCLSMAMVIYYMPMWTAKGTESSPGSNRLMSVKRQGSNGHSDLWPLWECPCVHVTAVALWCRAHDGLDCAACNYNWTSVHLVDLTQPNWRLALPTEPEEVGHSHVTYTRGQIYTVSLCRFLYWEVLRVFSVVFTSISKKLLRSLRVILAQAFTSHSDGQIYWNIGEQWCHIKRDQNLTEEWCLACRVGEAIT